MQSPRSYFIEGFGNTDTTDAGKDREQAVLNAYTAALGSFSSERQAFDAAVAAYLAPDPGVSVKLARRAVANIICGRG